MNCTIVKQLPNHCVPACLVSVARDSGITSITQEDIVNQFPMVFPNGVLDDVNKSPNLQDVIRQLGLANEICQIPFTSILHLAELHRENEVLLMWQPPAKHCVRICDVSSQLVTVMDPMQDEPQPYDAAHLTNLNPSLVFFRRRHAQLLTHIHDVISTTMPTIKGIVIGGDFNTNHDQDMFAAERTLDSLEKVGYQNGFEGLPLSQRVTHPGSHGFPDATFDFIFAKNLTASQPTITQTNASDHWPVTREFRLR